MARLVYGQTRLYAGAPEMTVRRFTAVLLVVLLVLGSFQVASLGQDELPFEVLITVAKAAAGIKPSDDDMKQIHDYSLHHATEYVNGVSFGDVVAILNTMVQTGARPPAAEVARMRTWATGMKDRKKKLVRQLQKEMAKGGGGAPKGEDHGPPTPNALVTLVADSIATKKGTNVDLKTITHFELGLPATVHVTSGDDFQLTWDDNQATVCKMSVTGTFHIQQDGTEYKRPVHTNATVPIHVGSGAQHGCFTTGAISIPKGAKRPYWQTTTLVMGVHSADGQAPNPGGPLTLDNMLDEGPFSPFAHIPEQYRAQALAGMQNAKELLEAGKNAKCTFDGARFLESFQKGGPFTQPFDYSYVLRKETGQGSGLETDVVDMKVHLDFRLNDPPIEALIEPAIQEEYEHWVPEGPNPATPAEKHGNKMLVRVRLVKQGTTEPVATSHSTTFRFSKVSHQPGVCMNWPNEHADDDPDLRFDADDNKDGEISTDKTSFTTTTRVSDSDAASVTCYDYGAYGVLEADVHVGTVTLSAKRASDRSRLGLKIPKDENDNHIADAWEIAQGIYGQNLPATWDGEEAPVGANKGDGFTLYEEYRGFVLTGANDSTIAWRRLEDKERRRKLIVRLSEPDRNDLAIGVAKFEQRMGCKVFYANNALLVRFDDRPIYTTTPEKYPRWINYNAHTDDRVDFGPRQFAVNVVSALHAQGPAYTPPFVEGAQWCPENTQFVEVHRDAIKFGIKDTAEVYRDLDEEFKSRANDGSLVKRNKIERYFRWRTKDHAEALTLARSVGVSALVEKNLDELALSEFRWVVSHELGHALGVHHHNDDLHKADFERGAATDNDAFSEKYWGGGAQDCPILYWFTSDPRRMVPFLSRKYDPLESSWIMPAPDPAELPKDPRAGVPDYGHPAPWTYCDLCRKQVHFHK